MKIAISGVGMVGGALKRWFEEFTNHELILYDPPKNHTGDISKADVAFICVPVPTNGTGNLDFRIMTKTVNQLHKDQIVFLRSSVLPGCADRIKSKTFLNIYSCPEFLTERQCDKDMKELPIMTSYSDQEKLKEIFPDKEFVILDNNRECELAKYAHNCFGAVKVTYFNLIKDLCESMGLKYENVLNGIFLTKYIDSMYTRVPGPDKKYGYGGNCFTKDMLAFNKFNKFKSRLIHGAIIDNEIYREKPTKE